MKSHLANGKTTGEIAADLARDARLSQSITEDLRLSLVPLVRDRHDRDLLTHTIIEALRNPRDGIAAARSLVAPYRAKFRDLLEERASVVFESIRPEFEEVAERFGTRAFECFDWGTGKGRYPGMLKSLFPGCNMSGGDVVDYRNRRDFPFFPIANNKVPQIPDASQEAVLLCFVLHHERHPDQIVRELSRIVAPGGRAIVIEHVPQGVDAAAQELDRRRILFADLVHCVVLQHLEVQMPGLYKNQTEWQSLFEQAGFALAKETPVPGTPLLYGSRALLVFESIGSELSNLQPPTRGRRN